MVVTHSAHGMCRARYHRAAAFRDSGGLRLGKSAHCERPEHMGERSVRVGSVQRHMLQSSSTTVGAAWSVWESGRWENAPSAAASESPLQQFGSLQEPSPRVSAQNSWSSANQRPAAGWALSTVSEPGLKASDRRAAGLLQRAASVS